MLEQVLDLDVGVENNGIPVTDGGLIDTIKDQTSNLNNATQLGDPQKATYNESDDDFNGHAVAVFNGAQYYEMDSLANKFSGLDKPFSVVQVVRFLLLNVEQCLFSLGGDLVNPLHFLSVSSSGQYKSQRRADDGAGLAAVEEVSKSPYKIEPVVLVWEFDGSKLSCYQNHYVVFENQYQDVAGLSLNKVTLGTKRWGSSIQDYANVELAYQEVYLSVLGLAMRQTKVNELMDKYAIDEYPYKSISETIDTRVIVESRKPIE